MSAEGNLGCGSVAPSIAPSSVYGGGGGGSYKPAKSRSRLETKEDRSAQASNEESGAQWIMAQKCTARAAEQSRIVMSRTSQAVKYKQTAEEARRAAIVARQRQSEMEAMLSDLQLESVEGQLLEVTSKYYAAKRNMMEAAFKLDMSQREVDSLKEQSEDLRMKQHGPRMEFENSHVKLEVLTESLNAATQRSQDFKVSSDEERQHTDQLRIEVHNLKTEKSALEAAALKAATEINQLETSLKAAQEAKVAAQSQHKAMKSRLSSLQFELAALYQSVDGHAHTSSSIKSLVKDLTAKMEQKQKAMVGVENYLRTLETQNLQVQKQSEEKLKTLILNQAAVDAMRTEVQISSEEIRSHQAAMEAATQHVEPLQIELQELREEIRRHDMRAEELSVRAEAMSDEAEIAQARKEEFWFQAMTAGKGADKVSDEAYMRMAEAAGMDMNAAAQLLTKNARTAQLAGNTVTRSTLVSAGSIRNNWFSRRRRSSQPDSVKAAMNNIKISNSGSFSKNRWWRRDSLT